MRAIAVGRVALDTRLGCVSRQGNAESKRIINAINTFFWTVAEVELRLPIWRFYKTKAYREYIAALDSFRELCMRHIDRAIAEMDRSDDVVKNEEDISIIERIVRRTGNPKIAAVLALDLFLVGVDTVRSWIFEVTMENAGILFHSPNSFYFHKTTDICGSRFNNLPIEPESQATSASFPRTAIHHAEQAIGHRYVGAGANAVLACLH